MAITILRGALRAFTGAIVGPRRGLSSRSQTLRKAAEAVFGRPQTLASLAPGVRPRPETVLPIAEDPPALHAEALAKSADPRRSPLRPSADLRRPSSGRPGTVLRSAQTSAQLPRPSFDLVRPAKSFRNSERGRAGADPPLTALSRVPRRGRSGAASSGPARAAIVRGSPFERPAGSPAEDGAPASPERSAHRPHRRCQLSMSVAARGRAPLSSARTPTKGSDPESSSPTSVPSASRTPACAAT